MLNRGLIFRNDSGLFFVEHCGKIIECRAATKLRAKNEKPLTGDNVIFEQNKDGSGFITAIDGRKNKLQRPPVANIDLLCIIVSTTAPEPLKINIDRQTAVAETNRIECCIVLNKTDLKSGNSLSMIYKKSPYPVFEVTAFDMNSIKPLSDYIKTKRTTVFTGASGTGKSSLINAIYPDFHAQTGILSEKIMRGKNTTRSCTLYKTSDNSYITDTPGFTSLDFVNFDLLELNDLTASFPDIEKYAYACKYRKCTHLTEEGCAVLEAVKNGDIAAERHDSYMVIYSELKGKPKKYIKQNEKTKSE